MELIFTNRYANLVLLFNGIALLFYIAAKKKKRQRAMKFGNYETLQKVAGKNFLKSSNIILLMKMLALTSILIGISSPVLVKEKPATNADFVIALDSSASMLASDIEPTRFRAAKQLSKQFVERVSNDTSVGVVAFGGDVRQVSELTTDKSKLKARIEDTETSSVAGTAIGDALYTSVSLLLDTNESRKVILITDGRNNVGSPVNRSIEFAKDHNVTINAIGIGRSNRSVDEFGMVNGVNASRADYPNLDTRQLYRITNRTGGELVTVSNRTGLRKAFLSIEKTEVRTDLSTYFILIGAILILIEWTLGTTRFSILP